MNVSDRTPHLLRLLLLAFVFSLPWENLVILPGVGTLTRLIGGATVALWMLSVLGGRGLRRPTVAHKVLSVFIVWNITTALWTNSLLLSGTRLNSMVLAVLLGYVIWDTTSSKDDVEDLMQAFVLGCAVVFVMLANNYLTGNVTEFTRRATIARSNQNDIALIMALGMPMAWYLATEGVHGGVRRLYNYMYPALGLLGVLLTVSRGTLLACAPFVVYAVVSTPRLSGRQKPVVVGAMAVAAVSIISFTPATSWERMFTISEEFQDRDLGSRAGFWIEGLEAWGSTPLRLLGGFGAGSFPTVTTLNYQAHNTAISVLVEQGLIGLMLMIAVIVTMFRVVRRAPRAERAMWTAVLAVWLLGVQSLSWQFHKVTWITFALLVSHAMASTVNAARAVKPAPVEPDIKLTRTPTLA